jgi:farnesyl-diphosphate farnesyltransferase
MTDLAWCQRLLPKVSRTFAIGIQTLPSPLSEWFTAGYLLCRVVDTVEDSLGIDWVTRRQLFSAFDQALMTGDCAEFKAGAVVFGGDSEGELAQGLDRILNTMTTFPDSVVRALRARVLEMSGGMAIYSLRHALGGGRATLRDQADLERYCYFVAGTVGHLLTDFFMIYSPQASANSATLRAHAEGFGLMLQLTNIVKDVTDDAERGWCFVPETFCVATNTAPHLLTDPAHVHTAICAIDELNLLARRHLEDGVAYILALPKSPVAMRRFCLLPMLLAAKTLDLALGNPAVVDAANPVKVSRAIVAETLAEVEALVGDDMAIAALTALRPGQAK